MRRLSLALLGSFLAVAPLSAVAQAEAQPAAAASGAQVGDIIKGVEATYKDVTAIKADFVQITRSTMMGDETRQAGVVEIKRPRMMRWEFAEPKSSFVTNGASMWVYTAADNQVIITEDLGAQAGGGGGMSQLLDGLDKLGELFDVEVKSQTESTLALALSPKQEASFKRMHLELSPGDYTLQKVILVDSFDNETELAFSSVGLNPEIADSRFVFTPPADATVVNTGGL